MIEALRPRLVPKQEWGGEVWFESSSESPLLIKYIFTVDQLSVQVHPDDAYARAQGHVRGKTEMWHVLSSAPGARVALGLRERVSTDRLREAARSGEIMNLLAWQDARPGDTFFIPAGTVHAIGGGLVLCEIQQRSDVTYRLYDYGRGRELHLDHGINVSRLEPCRIPSHGGDPVLVSCEYFVVETIRIEGQWVCMAEAEEHWVVLEGFGNVGSTRFDCGEVFRFSQAQRLEVQGKARLLRVRCPAAQTSL
jgi:mannose-6-phosphate isomerase